MGYEKCQGVMRDLDSLRVLKSEFRTVVWLKRSWNAKLGDNLPEKEVKDWALLLEVGNASVQPENVSSRTRRYLSHLTVGRWVKSSCQSVPGREPLAWWVGKGKLQYLESWSDFWQVLQETVIVLKKCKPSGVGWSWALTKWDRARLLGWKSCYKWDRICWVSLGDCGDVDCRVWSPCFG